MTAGERPLSRAERGAITALRHVATRWPPTLWLYSAEGTLWVMRCGPDGERVMLPLGCDFRGGGVDPEYIVATIAIPNDGGAW